MTQPIAQGSIRHRLHVSLQASAAVLAVIVFFVVQTVARQVAQESQDNVLAASAASILEGARYSGGEMRVDLPNSALSMLDNLSHERVFYAIRLSGTFLSGYENLPHAAETSTDRAAFRSSTFLGEEVRIATVGKRVSTDAGIESLSVSVAQTLSGQKQNLARISRTALGIGAAFYLISVILAAVIARSAIQPLDRLAESVSRRGPKDLRPVASSTQLQKALIEHRDAFDVAISSAMDLQTKLANDGMVQKHVSAQTQVLPPWASWNDMLFAFTQEPATIVVSKSEFEGLPIPRDRHELINLLRQHPEVFRGRLGTYDVRQSGLGYLFATQDTRASETYWRLTEVMGGLDVKLYCCSSDMIEALKSGELLIAYNVLGSYVVNREDHDDFSVILPLDFTTVMLRTAMIPAIANNPELSARFIDHLLAMSFGENAQTLTNPALNLEKVETALNRIGMGPGLLVFLDQLKKRSYLAEWENAIVQD